jgi:hypothetical protein
MTTGNDVPRDVLGQYQPHFGHTGSVRQPNECFAPGRGMPDGGHFGLSFGCESLLGGAT